MRIVGRIFVIITLTINVLYAKGNNTSKDSIQAVIANASSDSLKAEAYFDLSKEFRQSDINLTLEYCQKAVDLSIKAGEKDIEAGVYNYMGIIYYGFGDYERTLEYFYKVLSIYETMGDSSKLAKVYNNVGLILIDLGRVKETLDYYNKSLKIKQSLGDRVGVANTMSNIGLVYDQLGKLDTAHLYYKRALKIDEELKETVGVFKDLSNMGDNYVLREIYDSAKYCYQRAISIMDRVDDPYYKTELIIQIAKLNRIQKEFDRSLEKYGMALEMAKGMSASNLIKSCYEGLSNVHKELGNYKESLEYFEKYVAIQDEIFSEEQAQKLAQIESSYQIQQRENKIELLNKEAELKDLKISNTQMVIYWLAGIMVLIVSIIILQIRKSNFKTKANNLLKAQNDEIIEKNRNIMDSIICAKNIQQAILPEDEKLNSVFQDAFIMAKARDIVSGDFYWFAEKEDKVLIAAVDCTGHGVPAAFLNVMGNSLLNQIVYEANVISPSEVLSELNKRVLMSLKSNTISSQVDDGMDIGICMLDRKTNKLSFAGAKRPLYFISNDELKVVKGDYYPVGGALFEKDRVYHEHEVQLQKDDIVYLFTDGIVDQFGGEENKKFMYSRFKNLLKKVSKKPLREQRDEIEMELVHWQGANEQTDDMLLIGLKV